MNVYDLPGCWLVTAHKLLDESTIDDNEIIKLFDQFSIKGCEVQFDNEGFVSWKTKHNVEKHPFLNAEMFSLSYERGNLKLLLSSSHPVSVNFDAKLNGDIMNLTHQKFGFYLELQKLSDKTAWESPVSLISALKKKGFVDMVIQTNSGNKIECHKCIISSIFPDQNLGSMTNFLSGLDEELVHAILSYSYGGRLPHDLKTEHAIKLLEIANSIEFSKGFVQTLKVYLKIKETEKVLASLTADIDQCLTNVIEIIDGAKFSNTDDTAIDIFSNEPSRLVIIFQQIWEEISVAFSKFLLWCDILNKNWRQFDKIQQKVVCDKLFQMLRDHAKKFKRELENLLSSSFFGSSHLAQSLGEYALPQIEASICVFDELGRIAGEAAEGIQSDMEETNEYIRSKQTGPKFFWKLKNNMQMVELMAFLDKMAFMRDVFQSLEDLREMLKTASNEEKMSLLSLSECISMVLKACALAVDWIVYSKDESKINMRWSSIIVGYVLDKIRNQRGSLSRAFEICCQLVPNDTFKSVLMELGLIISQNDERSCLKDSAQDVDRIIPEDVETLYNALPTPAEANFESKRLQNLLHSAQYTDLEFVVCNETNSNEELGADSQNFSTPVVFKAHQVVVATRCSWFHRALNSGMRESIEKRFHIKDCQPEIFWSFLKFLYAGYLDDIENLTVDRLTDILTLADRYEVENLMDLCQKHLILQFDCTNVFSLLQSAERINAQKLKRSAILFATQNIGNLETMEDFKKLPEDLKHEILCKKASMQDK